MYYCINCRKVDEASERSCFTECYKNISGKQMRCEFIRKIGVKFTR